MCQNILQTLFGGPTKQVAAASQPASSVTREQRQPGQVKQSAPDSTTGNVQTNSTISIGSAIGQPDGLRKRTTELGL